MKKPWCIDSSEAAPLVADANTVFVDVREDEEVAEGVIPGALHIPLHELEERVTEIPAGKKIITVCAHGMRSQEALMILKQSGLSPVFSLEGGMVVWQSQGHPIGFLPSTR